jgi:predicted transcriptional regulator
MSTFPVTTINHRLRLEFDMTMIEYCIIQEISFKEINNKWYTLDVAELMKNFGISRSTVYNSLTSLQEKDLLKKKPNNDKLFTTTLLYKKFFITNEYIQSQQF